MFIRSKKEKNYNSKKGENVMRKFKLNYERIEHKDYAINLAIDIVDELNSCSYSEADLEETVWYDLEARLIYDDDRWDLMRLYQRPDEANYNEAFMECYTEICSIIEEFEEESEYTNNTMKDEVM